MSLRITALLVFIALVVTTVAIINPWKSTPEIIEEAPWFYQVAWEDLERVSIEQEKAKITYFKSEDEDWKVLKTILTAKIGAALQKKDKLFENKEENHTAPIANLNKPIVCLLYTSDAADE